MAVKKAEKIKCFCEKCLKTIDSKSFYYSNNKEKYPDGKLRLCKNCLTMRVDNWNPKTYLWILQEMDIPYIPDEWNKLLASYGRDPAKVTGTTILGRYAGKMKLAQYCDWRWKDTDYLQELQNKKIKETMQRQGYDMQTINDTIEKATIEAPQKIENVAIPADFFDNTGINIPPPPQQNTSNFGGGGNLADLFGGESNPFMATGQENYFQEQAVPITNPIIEQLTDEDRAYLQLKWGTMYKIEEQLALEKLFLEMMDSYDIYAAGHIDNLKLVCKASLKSNQLLDLGDVESAQKMLKMYDSLMKSGKWTAAQNKAESGEYVDSVSELVALCESAGFIPRFYIEQPNDKVDRTLQDLQNYTHKLITEETNLQALVENAVRQIQEQKEKEAMQDAEAAEDDDALDRALFEDDSIFRKDEDFADLQELAEEGADADEDYIQSLLDGEEL